MTSDGFREYLLEAADEPGYDLNGWNRTTYAALADTNWFWQWLPSTSSGTS
ncbi:hypothetical protein [Neorhizobium sp. BT27B]|uniref:hypothetical protein n=1 Tax=Neorhizobium sp. BT27B TaxID=3142625 RepID=UPI003D2B071A